MGMDSCAPCALTRSCASYRLFSTRPIIMSVRRISWRWAHRRARACGLTPVVVKPSPAADLLKAVEQVMAGVCESDPNPLPDNFDREHLRLITNKLTERAAALAAFHSRF